MANCFPILILRIKESRHDQSTVGGADWQVPFNVNFRMVLDVLVHLLPNINPPPTAFEYDDEDNDCITVRSDEELEALLTYCHWHQQYYRATSSPICIYPKYSKRRNALNLEVNTRPTAPSLSNPSSGDSRLSGGSSHRRPDEQALINLLSGGQITPNDLHYLEILGHGSGGTVYRTFHTPSKVIMAVKVLPLDATPDEQRQIISELEILHKCDSKYIIGFYGAFFQENKISICTEYMDGGSLDHFGAIPEVVLGKIAVGAVKGLSYLWSMKIMHRDIKPSNTLVNTQGHVKLCDFGVSVQLLTSLTQTFIGTNAYMAPERILGGEYGIHSEIWSLGVTLLEMALGRFPYLPDGAKPNTSLLPFDLLQCIVNEKPPSLPPDRFSPQLIDLTTQCLQKIPRARPGIDTLMRHPFLHAHEDNCEEIISDWVIKRIEHIRIMKRVPSDLSLASSSSSTSIRSGNSSTTNRIPVAASGGLAVTNNIHIAVGNPRTAAGRFNQSSSSSTFVSGIEFMETQ